MKQSQRAVGRAQVISKSSGATDSFLISVEKSQIQKAEGQLSNNESSSVQGAVADFIAPVYSPTALRMMVDHSTILPQCVRAYKDNIVGFGYTVENKDPENGDTDAQAKERSQLMDVLEFFSFDMPLKKLFGKVIEDREAIGCGYLEIERDGTGLPVHGYYVDATTIEASKLSDPIKVTVQRNGKKFQIYKRFRKYRQKVSALGGIQAIYFKEFGDPRKMDCRTGEYIEEGKTLEDENEANEIIAFPTGSGVYGTVRWLGQSIHVEGSRLAENLNYNYFVQGRHTNLAVIIEGGTLTDDSFTNLQNYVSNIQGVDNSHKMLLIEIDSLMDQAGDILEDDGKKSKPTVKLEHLNDLLQEDALFLKYMDESRKKVQSSFNLPDLYVGYMYTFNRSTAEAAIEVTERQVFGPEREDIAWVLNNKILEPYNLQHVYFKFKGPTLADQQYVIETFKAASAAGGITPQDARKFAGKVFEIDLEKFTESWANIPIPVQQLTRGVVGVGTATDPNGTQKKVVAVDSEVVKSLNTKEDFVELLQQIKKALENIEEAS